MRYSGIVPVSVLAIVLYNVLLLLWLLFYRPTLLDKLFLSEDNISMSLKRDVESRLSVEGNVELDIKNGNYLSFCVLPYEVDPKEILFRRTGESDSIDSYGWLMGWNDNNWHIVFIKKGGESVIVSVNSSLFPFEGDGSCGPHVSLTFDRVKKRVLVK